MKVNINLNLEANDLGNLSNMAAVRGIKVSELLENFVNDLVYGTYTNGSDERLHANEWFDRCGFDNCNRNTFLQYLYNENILKEFIDNCVDYYTVPNVEPEELEDIAADMKEVFSDYCSSEFCKEANPQFDEEARGILEWYNNVSYTPEIEPEIDMEM